MTKVVSRRTLMIGLFALSIWGMPLAAQADSAKMSFHHPVAFAVSPPLRELANMPLQSRYGFHEAEPVRSTGYHPEPPFIEDPVEQRAPGPPSNISVGLSVPGLDKSQGGGWVPPDTNATVGDTQLVEWVNMAYAVFRKSTGTMEGGPIPGNQIWQNLGGPCYQNDDGDPIVQWDQSAHRWLLAQDVFAYPFYSCVAVSTSPDALGTYYLYAFPLGENTPDYPKWGIWPSGYFQTQNTYSNSGFAGAYVCAYNSAKLLVGDPSAEQICFQLTPNDASLLPSDLDSSTPPPAEQDEFFLGSYDVDSSNNHLYLYSMHPVYLNPSQSTFQGAGLADPITVPTYAPFCPNSESCVPQDGTTTKLDALGAFLMYRFAYWDDGPLANVGSHAGSAPRQHWLVNHVVTASEGQAGVRWYEFTAPVRKIDISGLSLFQSGTFAPDSNYRWMASIARDKMGNIALGLSISSTTMFDSINATGRRPSDPLGQMEAEVSLFAGTGWQSGTSRWGDYSSMRIDSADGCTFWYAQEYLSVPAGDWQTQLTSFKFSGCQ